jgi:hypothetical protein
MPAVRGRTLGSFGQAFTPLAISGGVPAVVAAIELEASETPIITLAASETPVVELAASETPVIELAAREA